MVIDCVEECCKLTLSWFFKTIIWLMVVSFIMCFICLIHVLNWLKYKILYKIVVLLMRQRKEKCKFQIWKFTRSFVWRAVSDWFMMFLVFLWVNKPKLNAYFIQIDDLSVGWREEIDCWNWIFKPNLDDCW